MLFILPPPDVQEAAAQEGKSIFLIGQHHQVCNGTCLGRPAETVPPLQERIPGVGLSSLLWPMPPARTTVVTPLPATHPKLLLRSQPPLSSSPFPQLSQFVSTEWRELQSKQITFTTLSRRHLASEAGRTLCPPPHWASTLPGTDWGWGCSWVLKLLAPFSFSYPLRR